MTAKEILKKHQGQLESGELDQILALAINKKIEYLYKNPEKEINTSGVKTFKKLLRLRLSGYSLAYLMGYKEFCGLKFLVSRNTLIPRPESELIVEEALRYLKNGHRVLDIGTGTGALILSLAKMSDKKADYTAIDISAKALKIAKTNARKLKIKNIKFVKSNLLKNINPQKFDIVVANLPYLKEAQLKEPSIKKEPRLALLSGKDGLEHYRKLFCQINSYLAKKYLVLIEINPHQKEEIEKIISHNLPSATIKLLPDLAGNIRVVKISQ